MHRYSDVVRRVPKLSALTLSASLLLAAGCGESSSVGPETPATPAVAAQDPWLAKPVLNYLLLTAEESVQAQAEELFRTLRLSESERKQLVEIAVREQEQVAAIERARRGAPGASPLQVREHNAQVQSSVASTDGRVRELLGSRYGTLRQWLRENWEELRQAPARARQSAMRANVALMADVTTCYVFATQYNGYTTVEVALPDKYLKFANKGLSSPYKNPPYTVNVTRGTASTGDVRVDEVGPWNEDDNYWNAANGTVPRRMFKDLPLCKPEAEAAYLDGYNGGRDQFGRTVANPAGVDLTPTVASRLGLSYAQNAWVTVNYTDLPGGGSTSGIIVDSNNTNNNASVAKFEVSTNWASGTTAGYYGTGYYYASTQAISDPATFWFYLPAAATKTVDGWWVAGTNRSTTAPFMAFNASGTKLGTVNVNQQINGGKWNQLGTWSFSAGWNKIQLSRWTTTGYVVIADAVRIR